MKCKSKNRLKGQGGFTIIEVVVVILIVAVIGLVGYIAYGHLHKPAQMAQATKVPVTEQSTDPYKGWQPYCYSGENACIKYPQGWNFIDGPSIATQIFSADARMQTTDDQGDRYPTGAYQVQVEFAKKTDGPDAPQDSLTVTSIMNFSSNAQFKIIGGYYTSDYLPCYYLVDTASIQKDGLVVGKTSDSAYDLFFTDATTNMSYSLSACDQSGQYGTLMNVNKWFADPYTAQALLILKSFTE